MTYQKAKEEIIESSPQKTDAGKEELYLYSLRKMAEENVENNRTGLTNLPMRWKEKLSKQKKK